MERLILAANAILMSEGLNMNTKMIGAVAALVSAGAFAGTSYETALVTESRAIYEVVEISTPTGTVLGRGNSARSA